MTETIVRETSTEQSEEVEQKESSTSNVLSKLDTFSENSKGGNAHDALINLENSTSLESATYQNNELTLVVNNQKTRDFSEYAGTYYEDDHSTDTCQITLSTKNVEHSKIIKGLMKANIWNVNHKLEDPGAVLKAARHSMS